MGKALYNTLGESDFRLTLSNALFVQELGTGEEKGGQGKTSG